MRTLQCIAVGFVAVWMAGCDASAPGPNRQEPAESAAPEQPPPEAPAKDVEMTREKAAVGMGEKGQGYGEGPVATPIKALWAAKEQVALIQIQSALQLFKASDRDGRGPRTHQEFMEKIVKANSIHLPALPQGQRYVYDPAKEELMVEKPKQP